MNRPSFIQSPTLNQQVAVFNLIRKGRKIVAAGELTPEAAVEFRHLMDIADREFELPACNDNRSDADNERDLAVLRATFGQARALARESNAQEPK
jgi:hypothetical protein